MRILLYLPIIVFLTSCSTIDIFEQSASFYDHSWSASDKKKFVFAIKDSSLYNIYLIVRHEDAYHYNNIWVDLDIQDPTKKLITQTVEAVLSDNVKGWLGTGFDNVFDHRVLINRSPIRLQKGKYSFVLTNKMREDPLPNILSIGLRVERVAP